MSPSRPRARSLQTISSCHSLAAMEWWGLARMDEARLSSHQCFLPVSPDRAPSLSHTTASPCPRLAIIQRRGRFSLAPSSYRMRDFLVVQVQSRSIFAAVSIAMAHAGPLIFCWQGHISVPRAIGGGNSKSSAVCCAVSWEPCATANLARMRVFQLLSVGASV